MPLFSVIIPTYNRAELLRETLMSVFAQTFTDFEVVVVDDGSTDRTEVVVNSFGNPIRFLRQENKGPGAARNLGVDAATGDYVTFLDSDDLWFPWTLDTYARALEKRSEAGIVLGNACRFVAPAELDVLGDITMQTSTYADFLEAGQKPVFFGTGYAVVKRNIILSVGAMSQKIHVYEDQDFALRLGTGVPCVVVESPVTVGYRQTPGSLTTGFERSLEGIRHLIASERAGIYPGGVQRRWDRRNYISYSIRSLSFGLLQDAHLKEAWHLYRQAVLWQVGLGRIRYAILFPMLLAKRLVTCVFKS